VVPTEKFAPSNRHAPFLHRNFVPAAALLQPNDPHPWDAFVQAAADWGKKKLDDSVLEYGVCDLDLRPQ